MANKGQTFKKYTDQDRKKIVDDYIKGQGTYRTIGARYGVSFKTVQTMVLKYKREGTTLLRKKGRPKSNFPEIERLRLENEILKKFQAFLKQQQERK